MPGVYQTVPERHVMPRGGFPLVHLPFPSGASAVRHLEVVKIPTEDDVVGAEVGLIDLLPELGFVIRGSWSVNVDYG